MKTFGEGPSGRPKGTILLGDVLRSDLRRVSIVVIGQDRNFFPDSQRSRNVGVSCLIPVRVVYTRHLLILTSHKVPNTDVIFRIVGFCW